MSSTDRELEIVRETAATLHQSVRDPYGEADRGAPSFLRDRRDVRLFEQEIFAYAFETPLQLRGELERMWEYQGAEPMKAFTSVCVVSAFKLRSSPDAGSDTAQLSPFVYEY